MLLTRRSIALLLAGASLPFAWAARAADLPHAAGKQILAISGKIKNFNDGDRAVFDRAMIESLGMETIVTNTPWYKQPEKFEGVRMSKLMEVVGAFGGSVLVSALNDYSSEIPLSDFTQFDTMLALKRNGEYMPISDKGPLFIVYPFDSNSDLRQDKFYMRSVWQVSEMEVK